MVWTRWPLVSMVEKPLARRVASELSAAVAVHSRVELFARTAQVIQLLQGMAEKGKKEKHEEQVSLAHGAL